MKNYKNLFAIILAALLLLMLGFIIYFQINKKRLDDIPKASEISNFPAPKLPNPPPTPPLIPLIPN
jgi:hypothetical protein